MRRRFNTAGSCNPQRHYMVDLDARLRRIKEDYVDEGSYFVINKGRQYGKTTTLNALEKYLKDEYIVISLDFQEIGTEDFADAAVFVGAFAGMVLESLAMLGFDSGDDLWQPLTELAGKEGDRSLKDLFVRLGRMCACAQKPI